MKDVNRRNIHESYQTFDKSIGDNDEDSQNIKYHKVNMPKAKWNTPRANKQLEQPSSKFNYDYSQTLTRRDKNDSSNT